MPQNNEAADPGCGRPLAGKWNSFTDTHAGQKAGAWVTARPRVLDDATVAYVLETRRPFEDLRQAAAQLAGLLVLEAAGAKSELPQHPMLAAAEELSLEAEEKIRQARATAPADAHRAHLAEAAALIRRALSAARRGGEMDLILRPLRAAYVELEAATRDLPGFEMVAFDRGCCGPVRRTE